MIRLASLGLLALLVACDSGAPPAEPKAAPPAAPTIPQLRSGVDVSDHSGEVEWETVTGVGYDFAFVKATEGVDLADPDFERNWAAMKKAGLVRGAYHFYVTEDDPGEQADFFISRVMLEPGDLAPVVDIELVGHNTPPGLADRLEKFLEALEEHYRIRPIIYTAPDFWDEHLTDEFGRHPLWVAEYDVEEPRLPKGWASWTMWQWKGDAQIPGVQKGADLSRMHPEADIADLIVPH